MKHPKVKLINYEGDMQCFNHTEVDAVAICKSCGKALCKSCSTELPDQTQSHGSH